MSIIYNSYIINRPYPVPIALWYPPQSISIADAHPDLMLIQSCPSESDPRDKVSGFVSDRNIGSIGGLRTDGMQFLIDLVRGEIERQEPDSKVVMLDRDFLIDNSVDFARDLVRVMDDMTSGDTRINWIVEQDVPVMDWQKALEKLKGRDTQVYLFTNACRQVPCCFRLLGNQ